MSERAALLQSMLVETLRAELVAVGREAETPVVFLKAAWSDPVLFGAKGLRRGKDIDILVDPAQFEAFLEALRRRGWRLYTVDSHRESIARGRERTAYPPQGAMAVDVHRMLSDPPWSEVDTAGLLARAVAWESPVGPVVSLSAEDQVLHAVMHAVASGFALDTRHPDDIVALGKRVTLDWSTVLARVSDAGVRVGYDLLAAYWRYQGLAAPIAPWHFDAGITARRTLVERWVRTVPTLVRAPMTPQEELVMLRPLLSDRTATLPRFGVAYVKGRLLDRWSLWAERSLG